MKYFIFSFCLLCCTTIFAQRYSVTADNISKISFTNVTGNVAIEAKPKAGISIEFVPDEPITKPSTETVPGLTISVQGNTYVVTGTFPANTKGNYVITIPDHLSVRYQSAKGFTQKIFINNCKGDLDIKAEADMVIQNVLGGLTIQTEAGKVEVMMEEIRKHKPVSIITGAGNVYFTMLTDNDADLKLGSTTGAVYALLKNKNGTEMVNAKKFEKTVGNGGTAVHIQSLSGNIHLAQVERKGGKS